MKAGVFQFLAIYNAEGGWRIEGIALDTRAGDDDLFHHLFLGGKGRRGPTRQREHQRYREKYY